MIRPTVRLVFDRKHKATRQIDRNGRVGLIQLEICQNRKRKWIGTGISVYKDQWDDAFKVINHPFSIELNHQLNSIQDKAIRYIGKIYDSGNALDFSGIEKAIKIAECQYDGVLEATDAYIENMIADGRKPASVGCYKTMLNKLKQYGEIISFSDITIEAIYDFDKWMTYNTEYGVSNSSRHEYHRKFSAVINWFVAKGFIKVNPYIGGFKFKRIFAADSIRYLSEEECAKLEYYEFDDETLNYARDLFTFMRYTGMAFSDATSISIDDIDIQDGKRVIRSKRKKSGINFMIVVFEPAFQILKKYGGKLDRYSLSYIDQKLHIIGQVLFRKKVTTHMARHSFACWALKHGVPIAYISRMLGHTNTDTTQIYAEVVGKDLINESEKLSENIAKEPTKKPVREAKIVSMFG